MLTLLDKPSKWLNWRFFHHRWPLGQPKLRPTKAKQQKAEKLTK
ncbi:hypothetical protein Hsw_3486 [Hymenobacter swuensis DY53]|uniref:Uncharacterized protein n=1 Tax=Hymenobacter swuensis DY53 TaxID=1227739 RepID=W8F8W4_9BACT|nr:hypothetical protein Hsw_3486 [Hymenobacter swuensis DY53]